MYQLKVTVIAKNGSKPLLERIIELEEFCTSKDSHSLCMVDVHFGSIIESMNILYSKVPHVVTFSFEKL